MSDYRQSTPLHFGPPAREWKSEGEPMYADKFPELVMQPGFNDVANELSKRMVNDVDKELTCSCGTERDPLHDCGCEVKCQGQ